MGLPQMWQDQISDCKEVEKEWLELLMKNGQTPIGSDTCNRVTNDMQEKTMKTLYE